MMKRWGLEGLGSFEQVRMQAHETSQSVDEAEGQHLDKTLHEVLQ